MPEWWEGTYKERPKKTPRTIKGFSHFRKNRDAAAKKLRKDGWDVKVGATYWYEASRSRARTDRSKRSKE